MEMDATLKSLIFVKRNGENLMDNTILCKKIAREIRDELTAKALVEEYLDEQLVKDILAGFDTEQTALTL